MTETLTLSGNAEETFSVPTGTADLALKIADDAVVTIVDYVSGETSSRTMTLGARARVRYICVVMEEGKKNTVTHAFSLGAEANLTCDVILLGGEKISHTLRSECTGEGAESSISIVSFAQGTEEYTSIVDNVFSALHGGGEILMKAVAADKAKSTMKGRIEIGLGGGGTNTYLTQSVLMLDPTAKVDAVPGLEIKTNDVKASHSATVSRLTPEDLFAFSARGIETVEARRMYILGFLGDAIQACPEQGAIVRAIEKKYARAND